VDAIFCESLDELLPSRACGQYPVSEIDLFRKLTLLHPCEEVVNHSLAVQLSDGEWILEVIDELLRN
jgi:hypothetical protein